MSTLVPNYAKLCKISNSLKNGENLNRHTKHGYPAFGQHFRGDHAGNRNGTEPRKRILFFYCGHAFADPNKKCRRTTAKYLCDCVGLARLWTGYRKDSFLPPERRDTGHRTSMVPELFFSVPTLDPCSFVQG